MNNDTQVYPLNDLREHITEGVECPCNPTVEVIGADLLIIHNAFDSREIIEEAIANERRSLTKRAADGARSTRTKGDTMNKQPLYCIRCEKMVNLADGSPVAHEHSVYMGQDQPPEFGFCEFPDGYASCPPPEFDMDAWLETAEPPSDELDYTE